MRVVATLILLVFANATHSQTIIKLDECKAVFSFDSTLRQTYSTWTDGKCIAPMLSGVEDRYLGIRCHLWREYPISCTAYEPTMPHPATGGSVVQCLTLAPDKKLVIAWSEKDACSHIPNRMPHRAFSFEGDQICLYPGGACIAFRELSETGKERVDLFRGLPKKKHYGE